MEELPKVFLDCGTHYGEGLRHFIQRLSIDASWRVYSFECNPKLNLDLKEFPFVTQIKKAVWIENGMANFLRYGKDLTSGGSTLEDTGIRHGESGDSVLVETMDLAEFIQGLPPCELYVKMDIEGAETSVLSRLLDAGVARRIKELHVEWHDRFQHNTDLRAMLEHLLTLQGVKVFSWV
jgi:FkbM family methyltransferase